jgi:hypothetical protein
MRLTTVSHLKALFLRTRTPFLDREANAERIQDNFRIADHPSGTTPKQPVRRSKTEQL